MANKTEVKKEHIEGILGEQVGDETLALIQLFQDAFSPHRFRRSRFS